MAVVFGKGTLLIGRGTTITADGTIAAEIIALHDDHASTRDMATVDIGLMYNNDDAAAVRFLFTDPWQISMLVLALESVKSELSAALLTLQERQSPPL